MKLIILLLAGAIPQHVRSMAINRFPTPDLDVVEKCLWPTVNAQWNKIFETRLLHGPSLSLKVHETYITALFTNLVLKLYKNKFLWCSFKP